MYFLAKYRTTTSSLYIVVGEHNWDRAFRAVASMYSWGGGGGGVGQTFPNDEKNFRIFHGIRSHEGVCYPENEDAIYKQKYT